MRTLGGAALAAGVLLALSASAEAKSVTATSQVVAPATSSKGGKVVVPVLLSPSAEKRLRLSSAVARLELPKSSSIDAPGLTGGRTAIKPVDLRPADALEAKLTVPKKKNGGKPLAAKSFKVKTRASTLTNDQLLAALAALYQQLLAGQSTNAALQAQLDALNARVTKVEESTAGLAALQSQVATLAAQLATLSSTVGTITSGICASTALLKPLFPTLCP